MQKLLNATECRVAIAAMLALKGPIHAAVAYWGEGAVEELSIHSDMDLTIVCDIRSGGCNVDVVRELVRLLGSNKVLTHDRLHAKVWVGQTTAIIGSSNASANGLGFEGREVTSLLEANMLTDDTAALRSIRNWISGDVISTARTITSADFRVGARRHAIYRGSRPLPDGQDLITLLRKEPESFAGRNAFVWVWDHGTAADWAFKEIEAIQAERNDESLDFWQDVEEPPPEGSFVFDFDTSGGKVRFAGLWQVLRDRHLHTSPDGSGTLLLCRAAQTYEGLRLGSRLEWRRAAAQVATSGVDQLQLADFARKYL